MHNTNKDKKFSKNNFNRKKMDKDNSSKVERQGKEVADTAKEMEDELVGGKRSCLRKSNDNDPEWYAQDPQLLQDAYNLPFANRLGISIPVDVPEDTSTVFPYLKPNPTKWYVPGVYNILLAPVPGISTDNTSAVNVAAKKLFTFIRHANSGASNYQAPDLMHYLLAMDNCYTLWNWLVRLYGVARVYSTRNAYLPESLFRSMRVNRAIIRTLNDLRAVINQFGAKLSTMKVPSHLSYFKRHAWLFSNVFADSDSAKAQIYLYNPSILYKWVDTTSSEQLPYLQPVAIADSSLTSKWLLDGLAGLVDEFINPIFYSEDFNIMSGDILKAYGEGNCYSIPMIQEDYAVLPVMNREVAMQFENAKIPYGKQTPTGNSWRITQSNDENIVFNPTLNICRADTSDKHIYNFHFDDVTPSDVAVATRLNLCVDSTTAAFPSTDTAGTGTLLSSGSEIVTGAYIMTNNPTSNTPWVEQPVYSNMMYKSSGDTLTDDCFKAVCQSSQFDWSPMIKIFYSTPTQTTDDAFEGLLGDLDNYTVVETETLVRMNDVALLSMFGIPGSAGV
nr:putative capsid [Marmot picobirnavirus]